MPLCEVVEYINKKIILLLKIIKYHFSSLNLLPNITKILILFHLK